MWKLLKFFFCSLLYERPASYTATHSDSHGTLNPEENIAATSPPPQLYSDIMSFHFQLLHILLCVRCSRLSLSLVAAVCALHTAHTPRRCVCVVTVFVLSSLLFIALLSQSKSVMGENRFYGKIGVPQPNEYDIGDDDDGGNPTRNM